MEHWVQWQLISTEKSWVQNQELTEQVGRLWFHDISFIEAEKFYKNNLDKVSCDFFFSSNGLEFPQPQTVLLLLSFLILTEDGEVFRGPASE